LIQSSAIRSSPKLSYVVVFISENKAGTHPAFLAASALISAPAMAWESADGQHSTSASVAMSSDYMWRGYSQTDNEPAISGSFDYGHASGFYAGTWASNVDFGDNTSQEIDIYAGFSSEFGDSGVSYDIGLLRYIYPDENYGWNEFYASFGYSYFSVGIAHSGSVYDSGEDGTYYSLGFDYDLPMGVALSAGVGFYDYDEETELDDGSTVDSATDYRIGLSTELVGFGWDLTYTATDSDGDDIYNDFGKDTSTDGRFIFTVSKSL